VVLTTQVQHCKECVELLGEYIEGTLPPDRAKALEEHLSTCPPCITFVRTYKATGRLCRSVMKSDMPRELMASLKSFLGEHVPGFSCTKPDSAAAPSGAAADSGHKKV
jgi:anti-sigma factor RsiW